MTGISLVTGFLVLFVTVITLATAAAAFRATSARTMVNDQEKRIKFLEDDNGRLEGAREVAKSERMTLQARIHDQSGEIDTLRRYVVAKDDTLDLINTSLAKFAEELDRHIRGVHSRHTVMLRRLAAIQDSLGLPSDNEKDGIPT